MFMAQLCPKTLLQQPFNYNHKHSVLQAKFHFCFNIFGLFYSLKSPRLILINLGDFKYFADFEEHFWA